MNLELTDKVALVTGGASGIGAATALTLAREGCDVAVVDARSASEVVHGVTAIGRRAIAIEGDVRDRDGAARAVEAVLAEFGRFDILVCSAGATADATIGKMTEAQWDEVLAVNLKGCFHYNQVAARVFVEQRAGVIVNIASINGLRGKFGQANYAASKAGVIAMSKSLARELGRRGVNVNVVAPGMVETAMTRSLPPEVRQTALEESALGRLATPEDCAEAIAFLCSIRARHITGEVLKIDGGQFM